MSFWNSAAAKTLRWFLFLPVGLAAAALMETIPLWAYSYAANTEMKFTLLSLIIGIVVVGFLLTAIVYWIVGVIFVPIFSCGKIAPEPKIATVIFATLFVLFQSIAIYTLWRSEYPTALLIYKIAFSILLMIGVVVSYLDKHPE